MYFQLSPAVCLRRLDHLCGGRRCCASIRSLKLCAALERLLNRPVKLISFFLGGVGGGGGRRRKSRGSDSGGLLRPGLCVSLAKTAVAPELPASQRRLELGLCMGEGARTDSPAGCPPAELFAVWEFTPSNRVTKPEHTEWSKACSAFVARDILADSGIARNAITSFAWLRAVSHTGVCAIGGSPKLPSWPPA